MNLVLWPRPRLKVSEEPPAPDGSAPVPFLSAVEVTLQPLSFLGGFGTATSTF